MPRVQRGKVAAISMCCISAEFVLFCRTKENQKGRRCPQGMKAPVGLLSRRPVCEANAACSARQGRSDFDALDPTGCGTLRLLRALGGTRILQAAAPTAPPCFGRWPRSSPLQTRGYSPLVTPKQLGSIQKIQVAALKDFLCCADFKAPQPLRRQLPAGERGLNITFALSAARMLPQGASAGNTPLTATTPSREKANKPAPQGWLVCNI